MARVRFQFVVATICTITWLAVAREPAEAQDSLVEMEPFDELTLTEEFDSVVLRLVPLDLPDRKPPAKRTGSLRIRLFARPAREYDVAWSNIARLRLFEQMVLDQAEAWVAAGKFAEAYGNYAWLVENRPDWPGLEASLEKFLFTEASALYKAGDLDTSLARLLEVHARNPQRAGLQTALSRVADQRLAQWVKEGNFAAARAMLGQLRARLTENQLATVETWEARFAKQAAQLVTQARDDFSAQQYRQARQQVRRALAMWPQAAGARELATEINEVFSQVVVGVYELAADTPGQWLTDAAGRRAARLTRRSLMELTGYGPEGGLYACSVGQFDEDDTGRRLTVQLRPGIPWSQGAGTITGLDVSRRLLNLANPATPDYRADWAKLLAGIAVEDVFRVQIDLERPHFQPRALLTSPLLGPADAEGKPASYGPYHRGAGSAEEIRYLANAEYVAPDAEAPRELVEHLLPDAAAAVTALHTGEITVLESVAPWDLAGVAANDDLAVGRYAFPTVHALIPNRSRGPLANRTFRRALLYGMHREMILRQELLAGPDSKVLSGPFLVGTSFDDPIGYASDDQIAPRIYDPRLAITLATVGLKELAAKQPKPDGATDEPAAPEMPTLVLAHPPSPVAVAASQAIERHLERAGFDIELRRWQPGTEYDLQYVELAMWEPVVDAERLLGESSVTGPPSPYMTLALRRLAAARDSKQVRTRLQELHRLAHDELPILPLWQIPEHFAHHRSVSGLGDRPALLYQNVEAWRTTVHLPELR